MNRPINLLIILFALSSAIWSTSSSGFACDQCGIHGLSDNCAKSIAEYVHGLQAGSVGDTNTHDHEGELAAFNTFGNGWTSTSYGSSSLGQSATISWSIVPDGTPLPRGLAGATDGEESSDPSGLIAFLDGVHHGGNSPGGADITQRDWWQLVNSVFERWDEVSGINYVFEPNDDARRLSSFPGSQGVRGDHRIGGHSIDGQTSPTFLAYNYFPNNSDMVIDTDEVNRWSNDEDNYLLFRNMLAHEIAHGFGLNHVEPTNQSKLMEPKISTAYDGPQFDDILGAHRLYGDANEENGGNDNYLSATMLGSIATGQTVSIGTDAVDSAVEPGEIDFVSIDSSSDSDYFRFSIATDEIVDIKITPLGPTYDEGTTENNAVPFDASAQNNLTLTLFDTDGTSTLELSNANGLGGIEDIDNYQLSAGDYYVRVAGLTNAAQFFQLDITAVPEPASLLLVCIGVTAIGASRQRRLR